MVDLYSYDSILVTPLLEDTVEHLLSSEVKKPVATGLITELKSWKKSDRGVDIKDNVTISDSDDKKNIKMMPFNLVRRISEQVKITPKNDQNPPCISDLLKGSEILLPKYCPPPRNPLLVARLERIKADLDNQEYDKMIGKLDQKPSFAQDIRLDTQAVHRQVWMMVNFFFTVIGSFIFGYFASYYAGFEIVACYMTGLIFGIVVFIADIYFIIKNL